jgi:hypothetical protein
MGVAGTDPIPDGADADVLEQHQEVDRGSGDRASDLRVPRNPEVPEADALEQAQDVPLPPDEDLG